MIVADYECTQCQIVIAQFYWRDGKQMMLVVCPELGFEVRDGRQAILITCPVCGCGTPFNMAKLQQLFKEPEFDGPDELYAPGPKGVQ